MRSRPTNFGFSTEGLTLELPQRRFASLGPRVGNSVTLGVRPQHLRLGGVSNAEQIALSGNLMVTEQLGEEQLLAAARIVGAGYPCLRC